MFWKQKMKKIEENLGEAMLNNSMKYSCAGPTYSVQAFIANGRINEIGKQEN